MLRIETALPPHAALIEAMSARCFPETWSAELVASLLAQPGTIGLLALGEGKAPQGFILMRVVAEEAEILLIGVLPEARRRGLGRTLLRSGLEQAGLRQARHCLLEVAADDQAAIAFYQAAEFRFVGRRPGYYPRPGAAVDALLMRHEISRAPCQ